MDIKKIEESYGKELAVLLSEGLNWIAQFSCSSGGCGYDQDQAIIAGVLRALLMEDIDAFTEIDRVENLSYFQYPYMKAWLKYDHKFTKAIIGKCLTTLAWLVVTEKLSSQSPLVSAVTGLEKKYELSGVFVKAVIVSAKHIWNVAQSTKKNENDTPESQSASTQTSFEDAETFPEEETFQESRKDENITILDPNLLIDKTEKTLVETTDKNQMTDSDKKILLNAVKRGNKASTIDKLLKLRPDIKKDKYVSEILCLAVKRRRIKLIMTLLWHGVDMHFLGEEGNAPLHIAAAFNYLKIAKLLTSAGASVSQGNRSGLLPLHLTTDPKIIRHLLKKGADANAKTPAGDTALHLAVYNGNKEAVVALMSSGANLSEINTSRLTPLSVALQSNNQEVADILAGTETVENNTTKVRLDSIKELVDREEPNMGFINTEDMPNVLKLETFQNLRDHSLVTTQDTQEVSDSSEDELIYQSVSPTEKQPQGIDTKEVAVTSEDELIHQLIPATEIQPEAIDSEKIRYTSGFNLIYQSESTAEKQLEAIDTQEVEDTSEDELIHQLVPATERQSEAIVSEKVRYTSEFDLIYQSEPTAEKQLEAIDIQEVAYTRIKFIIAWSPEDIKSDILKQLALKNRNGPIHTAASEGRLESVMELLNKGVDIDTIGWGGYTALQYAAKNGHLNIVQTLIRRGANINAGNVWNWTALHHAAHYNHYSVAEFLLEAGADTQIVDTLYGKTPLGWATCNVKVIELFKSKSIYS